MQDDPFARAVQRAQAAEQAEAAAKRDRRQRQVSSGARTAFRTHFAVFLAVNLLLVVVWATTDASYPWFLYPLCGWGVGLVAHFFATQSVMARREPPSASLPAYAASGSSAPVQVEAQMPALARTASTTIDDLARLAGLHEAGALTDEEFTLAKAKLLK